MTDTTKEYVDQQCMIGSDNSAWVPCPLDGGSSNSAYYIIEEIRNAGGTDYYLKFTCPLPTNRGGKKLYTKGVKVLVMDADGNDYVSMIKVIGLNYNSTQQIFYNNQQQTSPGSIAKPFAAADCSNHDFIGVLLFIVGSSVTQIDIKGVLLDCYYD